MHRIFFSVLVASTMLNGISGCGGDPGKEKIPAKKEGKAEVGVGAKGEGYGEMAPFLKPAATFWKAKEKIAFEILVPKAMQLFEATEGRKPKSHEEFMKQIIQANRVKLPTLAEGLEYFYDAQQGQLMVRNQVGQGTGKE